MSNWFQINLDALEQSQLVVHSASIIITLTALFFARQLASIGRSEQPLKGHVTVLRLCLGAYLCFEIIDIVILHAVEAYNRPLYKGALSILTIFIGIVLSNLLGNWSQKKFGTEKSIDGAMEVIATYHSRLTSILFSIVSTLMVLYLLIKIWGLNSMLETTGFVGIIAAFLVLTNAIWFPDLYHGLVILNSDLLGDGDAIRLDPDGPIYVINRVSFVYTSLLNIETNNRAMIRNSKITESKVENLTKRATIEGLRNSIVFKVGYPRFDKNTTNDLDTEIERFHSKLDQMFSKAYSSIQNDPAETIAKNSAFDWGITGAGDSALELVMHYYLAPLPATKMAKKLRKILYATRQKIVFAVYKQAVIMGIDLATPALINIENTASLLPPPPEQDG